MNVKPGWIERVWSWVVCQAKGGHAVYEVERLSDFAVRVRCAGCGRQWAVHEAHGAMAWGKAEGFYRSRR